MSKFLVNLLLGILLIAAGIVFSLISDQYLYYGLMIVGSYFIIVAFVNLFRDRRKNDTADTSINKDENSNQHTDNNNIS